MAKAPEKVLSVGPLKAARGPQVLSRAAILLWGPSSAGKSTFAATGPGEKLWFAFGDNETVPVQKRKDVRVFNVHELERDELFRHCQNDNPFGLDKMLYENEEIETVVVDSATAVTYRALQKAVLDLELGRGERGFKPTMEAPGVAAYGGRNAIVLEILTGFLRVTAKHNVNIIITAHEADPTLKKEVIGNRTVEVVDYISVMLGGQIVNNVTWRLSEIWHMRNDEKGKRELTVRVFGQRKPMKTRMFDTRDPKPRFTLAYDPSKPDNAKGQMTIAGWHKEWVDSGYATLPIPRIKGSDTAESV